MKAYVLATAALLIAAPAFAADLPWIIKKEAWSATDEKSYSDFVQALGASGCNTVDKCLKSAANPYRNSDPADAYWDADCAKFPYLLRAYFAWKNGLPFSYANGVDSVDGQGNDIRYSPNGNKITSRHDILATQPGTVINGYRALRTMQSDVDSAMFRVHPARDGANTGLFQDFYSVKVDRANVRAGTMVYDAAGHVVVVIKVETDGRVRYFDAHPDNTVSRGVYGEKFARSRPGMGAGFKNFRSLKIVGASRGPQGALYGGHIIVAPFASVAGYSLEQYFGTETHGTTPPDSDWRRARFKVGGNEMGYFDFVRARMAIGELKYHPIEEMRNAMDALCGDIRDRVTAVQTAIDASIDDKAHPSRLPNNIYGTDGEWEQFSSPSRDARLKTSFVEVRKRVEQMVEMYRRGDPKIDYSGHDLPGDLRRAYDAQVKSCVIQYKRSNGQATSLDYDDVVERLFSLSFDPYDCVELRWGAKGASEMSSCRNSSEKMAWYHAEQRLRNQVERTYATKMNFTLGDLQGKVPGSGVDKAPDVDLRGYLDNL